MTVKRTSQVPVETLSQVDPKGLASQIAVEVLSTPGGTVKGRVSHAAVEVLSTPGGTVKGSFSHLAVEVLSSNDVAGGGVQPQMFIVT